MATVLESPSLKGIIAKRERERIEVGREGGRERERLR